MGAADFNVAGFLHAAADTIAAVALRKSTGAPVAEP
jgi:hypothetical protein